MGLTMGHPRLTRRRFAVLALGGFAGCVGGDDGATPTPSADNPLVGDATQRGDLELSSSAFTENESIPEQYGHARDNVNPPLTIAGIPGEAASLALVMDDPDAVEPAGKVWLHWLVWNIDPEREKIPEGWEAADAVVGENDFGNHRYDGPDPPDDVHTYRFKLYAIDTTLDLAASASKPEVGEAMTDSVLAQTQLTGTFEPV